MRTVKLECKRDIMDIAFKEGIVQVEGWSLKRPQVKQEFVLTSMWLYKVLLQTIRTLL